MQAESRAPPPRAAPGTPQGPPVTAGADAVGGGGRSPPRGRPCFGGWRDPAGPGRAAPPRGPGPAPPGGGPPGDLGGGGGGGAPPPPPPPGARAPACPAAP